MQTFVRTEQRPMHPVKAYLLDYTHARRNLLAHVREFETQRRNIDKIGDLYDRATKATSSLTALRVRGTPNHDKISDAVLEIIQLKEQLGKACKEGAPFDCLMRDALSLARECEARLTLINRLRDENEKEMLFLRYVCGLSWYAISHRMHVPESTLYRWHGKALNALRRCTPPRDVEKMIVRES